ncbi:hypothetical protein [Streptomyces sp. NPDC055140]
MAPIELGRKGNGAVGRNLDSDQVSKVSKGLDTFTPRAMSPCCTPATCRPVRQKTASGTPSSAICAASPTPPSTPARSASVYSRGGTSRSARQLK